LEKFILKIKKDAISLNKNYFAILLLTLFILITISGFHISQATSQKEISPAQEIINASIPTLKYGQLNKIDLPIRASGLDENYLPVNSPIYIFTVDILGDGKAQTFTIVPEISKHFKYHDVTISQPEKTFKTFKIPGGYAAASSWYLTYLRNNDIPDIIYFFVAGSGEFLNDFKIIGKNEDNSIDILFDAKSYNFPEKIGGKNQLFINNTQLIVTGRYGQVTLEWEGNNFKVSNP
jgi:hypothetical protein